MGKALKFPAEILGGVYANPYPKRDRRQEARESIAAREASSLKGELMEGWSKVAEEDKTMKTAFSAIKLAPVAPDPRPRGVPAITDFFKPKPQPDGTITHFYKPEENGSSSTSWRRPSSRRRCLTLRRGSCPREVLLVRQLRARKRIRPQHRAHEPVNTKRGTEANAVALECREESDTAPRDDVGECL